MPVEVAFPVSAHNAVAANKSFRLFTTHPEGSAEEPAISSLDEDDRGFEAMVARENLPNEPLMPRSHKSSARSFLKNMGQLNANKSTKSFLQNISLTSKHTNSTGLNNSQPMTGSQHLFGGVSVPPKLPTRHRDDLDQASQL